MIARLIMQAMNSDCCCNFMGPGYTLDDFERTMTELVLRNDSQYSYLNTTVAYDIDGSLAGICVAYDGAQLKKLRKPFIEAMQKNFNRDFSQMKEETSEGEFYIDSLAVNEVFRGKGIATKLLKATIGKAHSLGINAVGLLVDKGNPKAERLYNRLGFEFVNDTVWGGHEMRHLQHRIK